MWFKRIALLTVALLSASANAKPGEDEKHSVALLAWLKSEDGYYNPNLEMRRLDPKDPSSIFGTYAKKDIAAGTVLIRVPTSMILDPNDDPDGDQMECGLVRNLSRQLKLKDESKYAPYINYLLATQPPNQLPSSWSEAGKSLFHHILGGRNLEDGYEFPPDTPTVWKDVWYDDCNPDGDEDPMDEYAAHIVVARAWDDILIPVFDMMSHRNGKWLNTMSNNVHEGKPVVVKAKRKIEKGEQIYTTYNMCEDCGNRMTDYGTPEILRDYGFVEQYPQSWNFEEQDVHFRIDEVLDKDGKPTGDHEITEWIHEEPNEAAIDHLRAMMTQFRITLDEDDQPLAEFDPSGDVPKHEWDKIRQYFESMTYAVETAIDAFDDLVNQHECIEDGTCRVQSLQRYADLENRELECWDDVGEEWPTCPESNIDKAFDENIRVVLEEIESPYQTMIFTRNMEEKDTCFDLDRTLQICDSYRPQYHEMSVHNAVRYLDTFKRVLWVGGGDSMLLNEFVKYPGLELIVGLELDQRVTRGSFKYHGTQPHFDQDRVEWWFGDATKSLLMLPKDYFGTFDLVIVDLSETIMSEKVTEELDVLDALTLLLQPNGIMLKNEFYFGKFKQMFSHSVMVHWYDNPAICSQAMVMGSWNIDFMNPSLKDYGVDTLFLEPLDKISDQFGLYHDYARNYTSSHLCHNMQNIDRDKKPSKQTSSPGIIMIVEVEDATTDLGNSKALEASLTGALAKEGLTVVSTETTQSDDHLIIFIVLKEGYVIARTSTNEKYCGFDIHFWSRLEKQEDTKSALLTAVGSKGASLSSYRVIAGGMFNTPSWKEDEKIRGPDYEEICANNLQVNNDDVKNPKKVGNVDQTFVDTIMEEGVSLLEGENKKVFMLIGNDGVDSLNRSGLEGIESVSNVETIYCPTMANFNEFDDSALDAVTSCEMHLKNTLSESANEKETSVLVLDSNADKFTASILLKVFSGLRNKEFTDKFFAPDAIVVSTITDDSDNWRRNFMQLFKTDVFYFDPACYVEVLYTDKDDVAMKLLVANKADEHFIQSLQSAVIDYKEKTGLYSIIELIDGAEFVIKNSEEFAPKMFSSDDFDLEPTLVQWKSQKPLAHQIIFQMETEMKKRSLSAAIVRESLENAISKTNLPGLTLTDGMIKDYTDLGGNGCVFFAAWSGGSIVVLWDGIIHVDLNLFTYEQNKEQADEFEKNFRTDTTLSTMLRDEQPRGSGRVVSYIDDLTDGADPVWA